MKWWTKLRHWLAPLDYVRVREIPTLLELWSQALGDRALERVLDLASPQLLACHLARTLPEVAITYANPFLPELEDLQARKEALHLDNLTAMRFDARDGAALPPESMDAVISCSVLEHIADAADGPGDSMAVRNIAFWLKRGGILAFSVPFTTVAFEETHVGCAYGGAEQDHGVNFFQRFYDEASLRSRLLEPSGMQVEAISYIGEIRYQPDNIHKRLAAKFSGRWVPFLLGWSFGFLTRHFMERADDWRHLRKPYLAFVILRKR